METGKSHTKRSAFMMTEQENMDRWMALSNPEAARTKNGMELFYDDGTSALVSVEMFARAMEPEFRKKLQEEMKKKT